MATPIIMPKFGQMTEESTIQEWLKKEGDFVAKGDTIFTVETDKSVMEVESFEEGTLIKIAIKAGVSVAVQSVVGFLGTVGEAIPDIAPPPAAHPVKPSAASASSQPAPSRPVVTAAAGPAPVERPFSPVPAPLSAPVPSRLCISPRAAALARRSVIDPKPVKGTGPGGRIVEKDVNTYLAAKGYDALRISPTAKALAQREKLDVLAIAATAGRIGVAEIERAMAERPAPMTKIRQVIAERLTQSMNTAPHWYCSVSVDMGNVVAVRAALKAKGATYTVTDFISEAVILSLKEFPAANSSTDGKVTRWSSRVHLGLAVALDAGLVVPVVFNADELTMAELSACSKELFAKARAGKLAPDEMSGSTFTISNLGMMDVENFAAIINLGEAAILAVSSTVDTPVVRDGKIVIRPMMKITVSSDHRLIDGAVAARFVNAIKNKLEDVELWKSLT
jgi:pyruvate dehydrogenase E2 component (dihydrolipoamide acetyltransferase)